MLPERDLQRPARRASSTAPVNRCAVRIARPAQRTPQRLPPGHVRSILLQTQTSAGPFRISSRSSLLYEPIDASFEIWLARPRNISLEGSISAAFDAPSLLIIFPAGEGNHPPKQITD